MKHWGSEGAASEGEANKPSGHGNNSDGKVASSSETTCSLGCSQHSWCRLLQPTPMIQSHSRFTTTPQKTDDILMVWILGTCTVLGGLAALCFFWDKITGSRRRAAPAPPPEAGAPVDEWEPRGQALKLN